ncbi:SAM-dependent methyltransferase [Natronospira proteinivora]|uniref:SAM-dependent methyltransferase n=1 Tax=Natronospira proteinivora TaxID=1807133 RepID=A0ABT1G8H4_9GAMM|nr:class I SAM-dependent methyltransferase [Natronospira proteinivora]MCP1727607.1 SAM-dependent methyltransferase [Natronospira proteinivora]
MSGNDPIDWYNQHGKEVAEGYERLDFAVVHNWLLYLLPEDRNATILDIGAGSGRDAAWLAERGHEVVAVEPSDTLLEEADRRHPHPRIRWLKDQLPGLAQTQRLGLQFDFILLSAVWMHVPPDERPHAFRQLVRTLKPGGRLALTLRHGPADAARGFHHVSIDEAVDLASKHNITIESLETNIPDVAGRRDATWSNILLNPEILHKR